MRLWAWEDTLLVIHLAAQKLRTLSLHLSRVVEDTPLSARPEAADRASQAAADTPAHPTSPAHPAADVCHISRTPAEAACYTSRLQAAEDSPCNL